jgi:hypothetical protein
MGKSVGNINDGARGAFDGNVAGTSVYAKGDDHLGYSTVEEVTDALGSLGDISVDNVVPPLVGGFGTIASTLLIRKFAATRPKVVRWAPAIAILPGTLLSIPLYWWKGGSAVASGAVTSAVTGLGLTLMEWAVVQPWMQPAIEGLGLTAVKRKRLGEAVAVQPRQLRSGRTSVARSARIRPTASVPAGAAGAIDTAAFAGSPTF